MMSKGELLSDRSSLAGSATQQVARDVDALRRKGVDVVDLGPGEPDFETPVHIRKAAIAAMENGFTKYTANTGIPELKQAVCERYVKDYGVEFELNNTIISAGGKQALFNVVMALLGPGDEAITHAPGWPTIVDQVKFAGARSILIRTHPENRFQVLAEPILEAVTESTRAIIVNSPGNPTGGLISEEDLRLVANFASTRGIWVVLDLCYERLIYDEVSHNLPKVLHETLPDRSVLVGSLSKTYAMTGWRCGWAVGPRDLIRACDSIQSHCTSNAASLSQRAGVVALTDSQACVMTMCQEYRKRRDFMLSLLAEEPRIRCSVPRGAFYLFPDISEFLSPGRLRTSLAFAGNLLTEGHVAVTAGEAFDAPGFLRLSYATSMDRLREGAGRIREFVAKLQ